MGTPYETIYNRFAQKINDFNLIELDDFSLEQTLNGWLNSAIVRTRSCGGDFTLRNDYTQEFEETLSDIDVELLSMGMLNAWFDQYLNSTENVLMMIGGKEEKFYSQANHIAEIRAMREDNLSEMNKLHTYHTFTNGSYFKD